MINNFKGKIEEYFELEISRKLEEEKEEEEGEKKKAVDFRNLLHLFTFLKSNENFKKDKIKYPIILYFYIMIDGLGDFNWLDVYLLLLMKFGYDKKDLHIVIKFEMKLYSMIFQYTENIVDIKTFEFNNEMKQFLKDFFAISQKDKEVTDFKDDEVNQTFLKSKFSYNQFKYESTINKLHNIYAIIINNKTNLYAELKTHKLFGILYYIYIINKYNEYILNLIIDIDNDINDNIEIFINNYPLFKIKNIFPLIISFSYMHYEYLYNKYKYISMSEGGCLNIQQICSGVDKNFIGLYDPSIDLMEKNEILKILNITLINDKINEHHPSSYNLSDTNIIYSYAYLSKQMMTVNAPWYVFKLVSYICLLYCFDLNSHTKETKIRYLFISENFNLCNKNIELFKKQLNQGFNLTITEIENIYIIKREENDNIIIISFFKFLEKNQYLNMIYHSNMPNYTTGDLSAQESLMLGKFIIHDYMPHKQKFYNLILNFCIEKCDIDYHEKKSYAKKLYSFMNQEKRFSKFSRPVFTYEEINDISKIIIELCKIYKEKILVELKERFNFNNNFLILLVFVFCIKNNINLIDELATSMDFSILIKRYRLKMVESRNKYIKYKTKYLKIKLNI